MYYNNIINNFTMKTLSNAQARQLERIYLHFSQISDLKNDKTPQAVKINN